MKLRVHGDSIRLRLTRSEVSRFASDGKIEEASPFLTYGLEVAPGLAAIAARGSGSRITLLLPAVLAKEWTETDRVAIAGEQRLDSQRQLSILIEKEFRKLHGAKFDPDLYPNPLEPKELQC
jgi:hypothetical protein